ncbi:MAG: T9SS type A sorting domain-containing protein, partial [Bacteroidales bacterium]|nr:T9SS type A sorting domain-containing protein [Bacteroidales bacterium]
MKTKISLSILALLFIFSAFSQKPTIELTFTATYDGQYVPLESILIENLTQGGDITLTYPDTVLSIITNIQDNGSSTENGLYVFQNYPNPFKQQTSIDLFLPEKEGINISVLDILGRELTHYKNTLNKGYHTFTFYPGNEKYYLLTVSGNRTSQTIKMLNAGYNLVSAPQCRIVYTAFDEVSPELKAQKAINEISITLGDTFRFTGFAETLNEVAGSAVIENAPTTDTLYEFEIREGIRCPGTPTV